MGFFGRVFQGKGGNAAKPWRSYVHGRNRASGKKGGFAGGYGAWTFSNIMNAHCTVDDIVEEFGLDQEGNAYFPEAYEEAYGYAYELAYGRWKELRDFYLELIEMMTAEMNQLIAEAEELEAEAEMLEEEAESLRDEAAWCEDPLDAADLLEEANTLSDEAKELKEQAKVLREEANVLRIEINGYYAEMEMLSIEDFIDEEDIKKRAYEIACEKAQAWYSGSEWIPSEVLDWGYYDISSHNG